MAIPDHDRSPFLFNVMGSSRATWNDLVAPRSIHAVSPRTREPWRLPAGPCGVTYRVEHFPHLPTREVLVRTPQREPPSPQRNSQTDGHHRQARQVRMKPERGSVPASSCGKAVCHESARDAVQKGLVLSTYNEEEAGGASPKGTRMFALRDRHTS